MNSVWDGRIFVSSKEALKSRRGEQSRVKRYFRVINQEMAKALAGVALFIVEWRDRRRMFGEQATNQRHAIFSALSCRQSASPQKNKPMIVLPRNFFWDRLYTPEIQHVEKLYFFYQI
jgi:hypothetical protein